MMAKGRAVTVALYDKEEAALTTPIRERRHVPTTRWLTPKAPPLPVSRAQRGRRSGREAQGDPQGDHRPVRLARAPAADQRRAASRPVANAGMLKRGGKRPEIPVMEPNVSSAIVEDQVLPATNVEAEAPLGAQLRASGPRGTVWQVRGA
jgi:hypothetical protein